MGMKIIAGDDVLVISGKDKGKMGKVIKILKRSVMVKTSPWQ